MLKCMRLQIILEQFRKNFGDQKIVGVRILKDTVEIKYEVSGQVKVWGRQHNGSMFS